MANKNLKAYEDIIHLPHHVSKNRPKMAIKDRAAQFAPFAAVVGHESAVKEVARYTDQRRELDETRKSFIDDQLIKIESLLAVAHQVEIEYFLPDNLKTGGQYCLVSGRVIKIDPYTREIQMQDTTCITIDDIYSIVINPLKSDF